MNWIKLFLLCAPLVTCKAEQLPAAVDVWGVWSDWGPCSASCDVGLKRRYRECNNPYTGSMNLCFGDTSEYDICKLKSCTDNRVAFTATGVAAVSQNSGPITFPNILQNYGNAYDSTSGNFTCSIPGIYHFAFSTTKLYGDVVFSVQCHILLNGINKVGAYRSAADLSDYGDGFGIGTSFTHHLNMNDTVSVGDCDNISKLDNSSYSTFTGFLVSSDD